MAHRPEDDQVKIRRYPTPNPEAAILGNNNVLTARENTISSSELPAVLAAERELALASLNIAAFEAPAWIKALVFVLTPCCGLEGAWCRLYSFLPFEQRANVQLQLTILEPKRMLVQEADFS